MLLPADISASLPHCVPRTRPCTQSPWAPLHQASPPTNRLTASHSRPSRHTNMPSCCVWFQANIAEVEVSIPAKLHNSLIGTKGRLIRSIMEECGGVHIHFPVEGSGSDTVVIRGPSSDVEKAKKQLLHLAEEKVSATPGGVTRVLLARSVLSSG